MTYVYFKCKDKPQLQAWLTVPLVALFFGRGVGTLGIWLSGADIDWTGYFYSYYAGFSVTLGLAAMLVMYLYWVYLRRIGKLTAE